MATSLSTLGEYPYFFEFLKLTGIFPFLIACDNKKSEASKRVTNISFHRSGIYYRLNQFTVGLFSAYFVLVSVSIAFHARREKASDLMLMGSFVSTMALIIVILIIFTLRKANLCGFLNQWLQVEYDIVNGKANCLHLVQIVGIVT